MIFAFAVFHIEANASSNSFVFFNLSVLISIILFLIKLTYFKCLFRKSTVFFQASFVSFGA